MESETIQQDMGGEIAGDIGFKPDPMHQFEVHPILPIHFGDFDASFTNASLWMLIVVGLIALLL